MPSAPPPAPAKIGLIFNPRSHRNHRGRGAAEGVPGIIVASPERRGELAGVLAGFADQGAQCIAISGGDGTVRDVLTAGLGVFSDRWPALAFIPAGKTNALAIDLGLPKGWGVADAARALAGGRTLVRRPLVVRDIDGGGALAGFVLGAGLFTVAINAGQDAHRLGAFDSLAVIGTAGWGMVQALFGSDANVWRRGAPMRVFTGTERAELPHCGRGDPARRALALVASLERFPLGVRPFGARTGLKLGVIDYPARRLMAAIPAVAAGWEAAWLDRAGLHRCATDRVELELGDRFILDGEAFPAGRYAITLGPPLRFVVP